MEKEIIFNSLYESNKTEFEILKNICENFVLDENSNKLSYTGNGSADDQNLANKLVSVYNNQANKEDQNKMSFSDWTVYISYTDLTNFFGGVASVTVGSVATLFAMIGSVYPGVGTIVGGIIGLVGAATIVGTVTAAMIHHKGLKIKLLPPSVSEY